MFSRRTAASVFIGGALSACLCTPAFAQRSVPVVDPNANDPTLQRRLLTNPLAPNEKNILTLSAGLFESYDSNDLLGLLIASQGGNDQNAPFYWRSGWNTGGNLGLDFNQSGKFKAMSIGANAGAGLNLFSSGRHSLFTTGGDLSESLPIGRRLRLSSSQSMHYTPYYSYGGFTSLPQTAQTIGALVALDPAALGAISPTEAYDLGGSASLSYQVSKRSSLTVDYGKRYTLFPGKGLPDFRDTRFGGSFSRQISKYLGFHAGYHLARSNYITSGGSQPDRHELDIGVDSQFGRGIALRSGTSFGFTTGTGMLSSNDGTQGKVKFDRGSLRLTGSAYIRQTIGRTWSARASYERGWEAMGGFAQPFFVDSLSAGISGSLGRKTTAGMLASYSTGTVGLGTPLGEDQHALSGSAALRYNASRYLVLYTQYGIYRVNFPAELTLPSDFPSRLERQGVRAGVLLQLPLLQSR